MLVGTKAQGKQPNVSSSSEQRDGPSPAIRGMQGRNLNGALSKFSPSFSWSTEGIQTCISLGMSMHHRSIEEHLPVQKTKQSMKL
jgi:hypothetical protein